MVVEMKPFSCRIKHNPPDSYSDCVRACVATILEREDVPHTFLGETEESAIQGWLSLREWLKPLGYTIFITGYEEFWTVDKLMDFMEGNNSEGVYILIGRSEKGDNHAVVCKGGKVYYDPSWYREKLVKAADTGYWLVATISKI